MKHLYKRCSCSRSCAHPFWYRFKVGGRLHRGTTKTTNRKFAERIAAKVRDSVVAHHFGVAR